MKKTAIDINEFKILYKFASNNVAKLIFDWYSKQLIFEKTAHVTENQLDHLYTIGNKQFLNTLKHIFSDYKFDAIKNVKDKSICITKRIKNFDDVLEWHGINEKDFNETYKYLMKDEIAYVKLKLIIRCLNEGWEPNWRNNTEWKYYIRFRMGNSSGSGFASYGYVNWHSYSSCGSRFCYKNKKLAIYAGEQFVDIYKDFMVIE